MFDLKSFRILNKLTQVELAEYLGVTQAYISQIERGILELPDDYISKIKADNKYDLSKAYILKPNKQEIQLNSISTNTSRYRLLPLINLDAVGGVNNEEIDTAQFTKDLIPFINANEGDVCCQVTGRSMDPIYPGGCIVQLRKIYKWKEYLEYGQVYVLDLDDGRRLIKEVKKGKDDNFFLLHSCNNEYDDREIPIDLIYSVWLVLAKYEKSTM